MDKKRNTIINDNLCHQLMMISIQFLIRLQAAALQLAGERAMPHLPGELTKA
jgi:hypothetical protein